MGSPSRSIRTLFGAPPPRRTLRPAARITATVRPTAGSLTERGYRVGLEDRALATVANRTLVTSEVRRDRRIGPRAAPDDVLRQGSRPRRSSGGDRGPDGGLRAGDRAHHQRLPVGGSDARGRGVPLPDEGAFRGPRGARGLRKGAAPLRDPGAHRPAQHVRRGTLSGLGARVADLIEAWALEDLNLRPL